jgi:hypothetical protein
MRLQRHTIRRFAPTKQHPTSITVGNSVQNQQKIFFINSITLFIHQVYSNKDLSATTVMMTKTLALFFRSTLAVLFSERTLFFFHNKSA